MRRRDPLIALEDVLAAGASIALFIEGRSPEDYEADAMLRAAVERQFELVGEALGRALRAAPGLEERIPQAREAIGLRNVLAHGYDEVVDALVFKAAREILPGLVERVRRILDEESIS
jgi:uncharacterized protein with HEPN domain